MLGAIAAMPDPGARPLVSNVPGGMTVPEPGGSSSNGKDTGPGGLGGVVDFEQLPPGNRDDQQDELLKQLCELNLCLSRHPLHRKKYETASRPPSASGDGSQAAGASSQASSSLRELPMVQAVSDLGVGNLLDITCCLKEAVTRFRARDGSGLKSGGLDRSTALIALSCYTRLETLYSRTLNVLVQARSGTLQLQFGESQPVLPEVVIDGFYLSRWRELQLNFLIYTCEQTHERIRACMQNGDKVLLQQ